MTTAVLEKVAPPVGKMRLVKGAQQPIYIPVGCHYDDTLVEKFVVFSKQLLRWPTGKRAGQPVVWEQWQMDTLVRPILGVVKDEIAEYLEYNKEHGIEELQELVLWKHLKFETAFYLSARGTGKTTFAAALSLFILICLGIKNASIDMFAVSKEQAMRMFVVASQFVRGHDYLMEILTVHDSRKRISFWEWGGELTVRSGDAEAELGHNSTVIFLDELLAQKNRALWDTIVTSMGKQRTLLLTMTTPSTKVETFARQVYDRAKRVESDRELEPSFLPVIFETDEDDDIFAEETWFKACPSLESGFLDIEVYKREAAAAKLDATARHAFKVYRLAQWAQAGGGYLNMTLWDENIKRFPAVNRLQEMPCYFGLDMAGTTDLASLAILWWDKERDVAWVQWRHWSTQVQFERMDSWTAGAWRVWQDDPSVKLVIEQGSWIDADAVAMQVIDDYNQFRPKEIGIDSFRARDMNRRLGEQAGLPVVQLAQTGRAMQAAIERVQAMCSAGKLLHNGDKVARWAASSAEVKIDGFGFPKVVKSNLQERSVRIDPIDALCMAMDRRLFDEREPDEEEEECHAFFVDLS